MKTAAVLLAMAVAALAACDNSEDSRAKTCARAAGEHLPQDWGPREQRWARGPSWDVIDVRLMAHGQAARASCRFAPGKFGPALMGVAIEGRLAQSGDMYLPAESRWRTEGELAAAVDLALQLRPGEFSGSAWRDADPQDAPSDSPARAEGAVCRVLTEGGRRRLWSCRIGEDRRNFLAEDQNWRPIEALPEGLPPVDPPPKAPDPDQHGVGET